MFDLLMHFFELQRVQAEEMEVAPIIVMEEKILLLGCKMKE
jgi:hypothetical protein